MFSYTRFDISPKQRGIFIHVPRTGGTSISRHVFPRASRMFLAHSTASFVQSHIGDVYWEKLFTFSFVRNPYERLVSWYLFYKKNRPNTHFLSFDEFLKRDTMIMGSFVYNGWMDVDLWSQSVFLTADGSSKSDIIVDFVGRYENFDEDMSYICEKLELPKLTTHKHNSGEYDYKDYYTDELKALVKTRCAWEIKTYGYKY
jgi:chondroitin 4-sulfotransferase 11